MRVCVILICLFLPRVVSGLDQIVLKSGVVVEGIIEKRTSEAVTVTIIPGGFSMLISRDKISGMIINGRTLTGDSAVGTKARDAETEPPAVVGKEREEPVPDAEKDPALQVGEAVPEGIMPGEGRYKSIEAFIKSYPDFGKWQRIDAPPVYVFHKYDSLKREKLHTRIRERAVQMAKVLHPKEPNELLKNPVILVVYDSIAQLNKEAVDFKVAGLYMTQLDYIKMPLAQRQMWVILRHELLHLMYHRAVGRRYSIPDSLNEGFAVYEEKYRIDSKPVARRGMRSTDVSLSRFLRANLTDRDELGLTVETFYQLSLGMTRMFLIRKDPATYIAFSREISRIIAAPDKLWKRGVEELLRKYYNFQNIEQAEKSFKAELK